ncbi:hypothetical protein FH608_028005 [Nonomuraea phyllanthi]|uniref:Uncharacterized protein n=1 Tax=Nonomuraea phyllanthi TaxID=2219224 RepID=A0A5C4W4H1_9ACTN|nr:hypothetical protein [Nonomuraea phyllanthi]KAB8191808.1 hypothetical protein FH608_028005 [Nonomuraea phyllanthi]QFY10110.1 hypothetical protein GBF35_28810 [Nonomuraea phyllanthi]
MGVALSITPVAGASASATSASAQRVLQGSCTGNTNDWFRGRVNAYYEPDGSYDVIKKIQYELVATKGSSPGKKSNVRLRIRESISGKPDKTLYTWESGDNVTPDKWHTHYPYRKVAYKKKWHVDAKFVFDSSGYDPTCTATTNKA